MPKQYLHRDRSPLDLTFIGKAAANAATVSLPSFQAGDIAIVWAVNSAATIPSLPSGWTSLVTSATSVPYGRLGYRVLVAGDTTIGTWTNATSVGVVIYRGHASIGTASAFTSSGTVVPTFVTSIGRTGAGWQIGFLAHAAATNVDAASSASTVNRSSGWGSTKIGAVDTDGGAWPAADQSFTVNATGIAKYVGVELVPKLPGEISVSATTPTKIADPRNRSMNDIISAVAQTTIALTTNAVTSAQPSLIGRWVLDDVLTAGATAALNEIAAAISESNSATDFRLRAVVAVWRPSTRAVVGRIHDLATEIGAASAWVSLVSPSGSAVTAAAGDVLILELWRDSTVQTMGTAYTNTLAYDGTTEGSTSNAASFFDYGAAGGGGTDTFGTDTGTATDAATETAAQVRADAGAITEAVGSRDIVLVESVSGADTSATSASYQGTDTISATDASALTIPIAATEAGVATDASIETAVLVPADGGIVVDAVGARDIVATDVATGTDRASNRDTVLTESGAATDASTIAAALVATETGTTTDLATEAASAGVSDAATGTDASSPGAQQVRIDAGAVTDASALIAAFQPTEAITGSDLVDSRAFGAVEFVTGTDISSVTTAGGGADWQRIDSITAADTAIVTVVLTRTDSVGAAEASTQGAAATATDAGAIAETAAETAAATVTDAGTATDASVSIVPIVVSDVATGLDTLTPLAVYVVTDAGSIAEAAAIAAMIAAAESITGADLASTGVAWLVTDAILFIDDATAGEQLGGMSTGGILRPGARVGLSGYAGAIAGSASGGHSGVLSAANRIGADRPKTEVGSG